LVPIIYSVTKWIIYRHDPPSRAIRMITLLHDVG
jgi:hypothetical protein